MGISGNEQDVRGGARSYTPEFLELERKKRYGFVNRVDEADSYYQIKMFFPSIIPPSQIGDRLGLADVMPDYAYDISLEEDVLLVRARLTDEKVLKLTGVVNSFPDRFYKEFVFEKPVANFEATYRDKILTIVVHKDQSVKTDR